MRTSDENQDLEKDLCQSDNLNKAYRFLLHGDIRSRDASQARGGNNKYFVTVLKLIFFSDDSVFSLLIFIHNTNIFVPFLEKTCSLCLCLNMLYTHSAKSYYWSFIQYVVACGSAT